MESRGLFIHDFFGWCKWNEGGEHVTIVYKCGVKICNDYVSVRAWTKGEMARCVARASVFLVMWLARPRCFLVA